MYHLATVVPRVQRIRIPLSRDQVMLLLAAINEIFLGIDIYLAHEIISPREEENLVIVPSAGHIDLIIGNNVLKEVFKPAVRWLLDRSG